MGTVMVRAFTSPCKTRRNRRFWVCRNDIHQIRGESLLGVAEQQAELWIKKMVMHDNNNPHQKKYHFDIARMKSHLRKGDAGQKDALPEHLYVEQR